MEEHIVKILDIGQVTHDVRRFRVEKPEGYSFIPGQATEVSVNAEGWKDKKRPFTFTCLTSAPYLEFTTKIYNSRNGVTNELSKLEPGGELIIRDVWGTITYQGQGVFIAGGAGVTPFISILRDLETKNEISGNILVFANKTKSDIILDDEFRKILGSNFINILSEENIDGYHYGFISESFLKEVLGHFNRRFYVCGPPPMMNAVLKILYGAGIGKDLITLEL